MEELRVYRKIVWVVIMLTALALGVLAVAVRPMSKTIVFNLLIVALAVTYLAVISFRLIRGAEEAERKK